MPTFIIILLALFLVSIAIVAIDYYLHLKALTLLEEKFKEQPELIIDTLMKFKNASLFSGIINYKKVKEMI